MDAYLFHYLPLSSYLPLSRETEAQKGELTPPRSFGGGEGTRSQVSIS